MEIRSKEEKRERKERKREEKRERKERKREEKRERKERKREEKRKEKERKFQESMERNDRSIIGSDISLLQIGVVFLAVVSFFTTANGMRTYIFTDDAFVAYAASGAIQSILLALSMNLPGYLSGISKRFHAWWGRALLRSMIILLTFVTISCSSWFSYVYIAAVLHEDSWEIDSELLVQQTYREELYDASEYANLYRVYLEEEIGEKILLLENQANALSKEGADFGIEDWTAERDAYVQEGGTTVSGYMATVIAAMEAAMDEDSGKEARDFAAAAVADAKESIAARIESNQANRDTQNENITNYQNQIAELTRRINNAAEGVDTTGLYASINRYTQNIDQATQRLLDLDTEDLQLDRALDRLSFYESCLGLNSSTSAISIRSELLMLQAEIFQQEVDVKGLLDMATNIFENLRNAAHSSESKDALDSEQQLAYTSLLIQMNQLIRNLKDYAGMKEIEAGLEALIAELSEIGDGAEADGSAGGHQKDGDSWKEEWRERFEELKAQISAMPTYSGSGEREDGAIGILSESQADILRSYDRNESGKKLDDILRRYIAVHNAVYAGVIYLQSPYRSLAIFALVLAYSFDLSGFVFGFVIQGRQGRGIRKGKGGNEDDTAMPPASAEVPGPGWSILETGERYLVLPGDYECRDGEYFYRVFRDGILEQ